MAWLTAALEILKGILKVIPIVNKWFSSTATEKAEKQKKKLREVVDDFKKGGRPKW